MPRFHHRLFCFQGMTDDRGGDVFKVLDAEDALYHDSMEQQLRHWRSVALIARAESACERAKTQALTAELSRARCDQNMAEMEVGLLRKQLSALEGDLARARSGSLARTTRRMPQHSRSVAGSNDRANGQSHRSRAPLQKATSIGSGRAPPPQPNGHHDLQQNDDSDFL